GLRRRRCGLPPHLVHHLARADYRGRAARRPRVATSDADHAAHGPHAGRRRRSGMMRLPFARRSTGSFIASIAIHVAVVAALVQIVFRYPLGQLMGIPRQEPISERVQFVRVAPQPTENSGGCARVTPPRERAPPAPLITPTVTPT